MGLRSSSSPGLGVSVDRSTRALRLSELPQSLSLVLGDLLSAALALQLTSLFLGATGRPALNWSDSLIWVGFWILWRAYQGLYPGYGRSPQTELRLHTVGTVQLLGAQLAAAFAVHQLAPSALGLVLQWGLILVLALLIRYGLRSLLIRGGQYGRAISVIGAGQTAALTIAHLRSNPAYGLNPVVAYDDNPALHGTLLEGVPIVGTLDDALNAPRTAQALISIPGARAEVLQRVVNSVYAAYPSTWVVPDLFGVPNQALQPHNIGSIASLEIKNNLRSVQARFVKRVLDLVLSVVGLTLIFPILLIIALLIRLDSEGPAIYKAERLGRDGKTFPCYKFRSMYQNAEQRLVELLATDADRRAEYEKYHKLRDDPRVTRIGALLRKTSLDELPQLLNVVLGQMSLVGPRPYLPREQPKMGNAAREILLINPGMTGYWQVNERNESTFERRLDMDRFYIANWSPWLDVVILMQTIRVVLLGKGAY
ncbi:undecaprenyl-phosphate galactose phosphotransferase WbaP (plasmid) [Deinococcus wulumuqiensis]|uniref:Undecaprenyl-phosphate galactose phosphotransferase WbaP n=1 Tax=Deinococcus wulumuqiensis TaxID=980427 RepID=A0A345IKV6_9DEIO|nr:undecaprenyl-phosphate galactose phosphotransferase WbaP [Deinococcus wulumuqiensis]AXH00329.1 undecaprenyl-phosphate galactose phosphotransferase WbaP [Deinococcus wulumuqiensis]